MPPPADRPISYSRINTYTYLCPYAYYLRYVRHLPQTRDSLNRVWGSALHSAIQLWHLSGRSSDLSTLMDNGFTARLAPWPEVQTVANTIQGLVPEYDELMLSLSDYKQPTATRAYKDSEVVAKLGELNDLAVAASADTTLAYPKREGLLPRMRQHAEIAKRYIEFDESVPLLEIDGTPTIELDFTQEVAGIACRAIVDQIRLFPEGPVPVDLKSNVEMLPEELLRTNYQLAHYQLLMMLTPGLPDPAGAAQYGLREGVLVPMPRLTADLADEWVENIRMVLSAEAHGIFPRRRDSKCLQCDWWADHCKDRIGATGKENVS